MSRQKATRDVSTMEMIRGQTVATQRLQEDEQLRELLKERRRREIRSSMVSWATHRLAPMHQEPARHHRIIMDHLERVVTGEIDRLMVLAPPGSAKTTYTTKLFVPYWYCKHPRSDVISASHTANLAGQFGREVRNMVDEEQDVLGFSLREDSRAVDRWTTDQGGAYVAAGVGVAIAGVRADLALIDDPFKSYEDAESEISRGRVWNWYVGDVVGRLKPGGRVVLINTHWHEDDLAGRLMEKMQDGTGEKWTILSFEALREDMETPDPLNRAEGEALWPEWESREQLLRKRATVGDRNWYSQYQQRPLAKGANLIDEGDLQLVSLPPAKIEALVRCWDLAGTEQVGSNNPDWTVGLLLARLENRQHMVLDVVRFRAGPSVVEQRIRETAEKDGTDVPIVIPQDVGQAGKAQSQTYVKMLAGWVVKIVLQTGSKETRAGPVIAQIEAHQLLVASDRLWTRKFCTELGRFPAGSKDDQVDALAGAFNYLVEHGGSTNIIEYYEMLRRAGPTGIPRSELEEAYLAIAGESDDRPLCFTCQLDLGNSYCTDGEHRWHATCRAP